MDKLILKLVTLLATLAIVTQGQEAQKLPPLPPDPCASAKIKCLKPSQKELQTQLEKFGAYPRSFVGITSQDACNFTFPSSVGRFQNFQQFSATPTQLPQRDSGLAEDDPQPRSRRIRRSPTSKVLSCIGKASKNGVTGLFHMCDMCWQETTLEENKFPRVISELVCQTGSSASSSSSSSHNAVNGACLGHTFLGKCVQKVLNLQFLRWDGEYEDLPQSTAEQRVVKQKWVAYTQEIKSCCECEASQTFGG